MGRDGRVKHMCTRRDLGLTEGLAGGVWKMVAWDETGGLAISAATGIHGVLCWAAQRSYVIKQ